MGNPQNLKCDFFLKKYGKLLDVFCEDRHWIINEVDKKNSSGRI